MIISLDSRRSEPHHTGPAVCLACGHEWVSVAPIGVYELECPSCLTMRGVYRLPLGHLGPDYAVWTCKCGYEHMDIFAHKDGGWWIVCARCGELHSVDSVFQK